MNGSDVIAGRFEILGPIARGNMGEVRRARDRETGETVAVKTMRLRRDGAVVSLTEADKNATRFLREVRIMERLSSQNLPRTIAGGLDGDLPYLAMEYLDGTTLKWELDEETRLPAARAAAYGAQIAEGLAAAHRAGVVHRDLKPANVMLTAGGVVKVLDFGVGLILDDVDGGRLTSSDVTVGTARYMAPEQARQHSVTGAADLYALGCVLYEMLTGAPPFDGGTTYELLSRHVEQVPAPVRMLRSEVPAELDALVSRLLEKDPASRPADAAEVAELLGPIALSVASSALAGREDPAQPLREHAAAARGRDEQPAKPPPAAPGELVLVPVSS